MGIGDFRGENRKGIPIQFSNECVKMGADKLDIKDAIPTFMILLFMRTSQMGSDNHPKITIGQVMDFFEREVNKPSDPGIVCDPVTFVG